MSKSIITGSVCASLTALGALAAFAGLAACSGGDAHAMPDASLAPRCVDDMMLELPGPCAGGTCLSTCPFGCQDAACAPEPCLPDTCSAGDTCTIDHCGDVCGPCESGGEVGGTAFNRLSAGDHIAVSPDGSRLAALRQIPLAPCAFGGDPGRRLDVMPTDLSARQITIGAHVPNTAVAYTAAGDLVYIDRLGGCSNDSDLWIAHGDGSQPHRLTGDVLSDAPAFQLSGSTLVYRSVSDHALYAIALPDGAPVKLASLVALSGLPTIDYQLSPDASAVWARERSLDGVATLVVAHTDGSGATTLLSASNLQIKPPVWSPDSRHLAYAWATADLSQAPAIVVDRDGNNPVVLGEHTGIDPMFGGVSDPAPFGAFSPDGQHIAFFDQPPAGGFDAVVHSFTGGPDVRIANLGRGQPLVRLGAIGFSNDGRRVLAAIVTAFDGSDGFVVTGPSDAGATAQLLADVPGPWTESPDGSVVVVGGPLGGIAGPFTEVVTIGGTTQVIAGPARELPQFSAALASPSLLVQIDQSLALCTTAGTAATPLAGFAWTQPLSDAVHGGAAPFAFGWAGITPLYPAAVSGEDPGSVHFDLMTRAGRVLANVVQYEVRANPTRVFAVTTDHIIWMAKLPD